MADSKLSALPTGTTPDYYYGIEGSISKKYNGLKIFNVKDYGALGNNSNDDTAEIQAAINAASAVSGSGAASKGAIVYFPPGTYIVSGILQNNTVGSAIRILGSGQHCTVVSGSVNGFIFNSNIPDGNAWNSDPTTNGFIIHYEHIYIKNSHAMNANLVGAVRFSQNYAVGGANACVFQGAVGVDAATNNFSTIFTNCDFTGVFDDSLPGTVGCYAGQCSFYNCSFTLYDHAIRAFSVGIVVSGCRFETNLCGIRMGTSPAGLSRSTSACTIIGNSYERNEVCIYIDTLTNSLISSQSMSGTIGVAHAITTASYSGGTITVTSAYSLDNFGWTSGTRPVKIESASPAGYGTSTFKTATRTNSTTFTYVADGGAPGTFNSATWSFKPQYGLRVNNMDNCTLIDIGVGFTECEGSGIDLFVDGTGSTRKNTLISCSAGTFGWTAPHAVNKASYTMLACDTTTNFSMGFGSLPGQAGNYESTAIEGMRFYITDSNQTTLGGTVAGGGSTRGWVGYNGTNWTQQSK